MQTIIIVDNHNARLELNGSEVELLPCLYEIKTTFIATRLSPTK